MNELTRPSLACRRSIALACLLLLATSASSASAQDEDDGELVISGDKESGTEGEISDDEKEAVRLFKIAQLQFEGSEFEASARTFAKAFELDPNPILAFNVARAHENNGALDEAKAFYEKALSLSPPPEVEKRANTGLLRIDKARASIKKEVAAAGPRTGHLNIAANVDAEVLIDGVVVGRTPHEAELDPKVYRIEMRSKGYFTFEQQVSVEAGDRVQVSAALEEEPDLVSWLGWTGIGLAAAGASGLVAGFFFEKDAQEAFDEAQTLASLRNPARFDDLRLIGEEARDNAELAYLSGIGAITLGGLLLATDLTLNLSAEADYSGMEARLDFGLDRVMVRVDF